MTPTTPIARFSRPLTCALAVAIMFSGASPRATGRLEIPPAIDASREGDVQQAPCPEGEDPCAAEQEAYEKAAETFRDAKREFDAATDRTAQTAAAVNTAAQAVEAARNVGGAQLAQAQTRLAEAQAEDARAVQAQQTAAQKLAPAQTAAQNAEAALDACRAKVREKCDPKPEPQPGGTTTPGAPPGGTNQPLPGTPPAETNVIGGRTPGANPTGPSAPPSMPACKNSDADCDALRQTAREKQALADAASRELRNDVPTLVADADAADRSAIGYADLATQTFSTAAGYAALGQKDQQAIYMKRAQEFEQRAAAERARAQQLRARANAILEKAAETAEAAKAAWSAYSACLQLPPCPAGAKPQPSGASKIGGNTPTKGPSKEGGGFKGGEKSLFLGESGPLIGGPLNIDLGGNDTLAIDGIPETPGLREPKDQLITVDVTELQVAAVGQPGERLARIETLPRVIWTAAQAFFVRPRPTRLAAHVLSPAEWSLPHAAVEQTDPRTSALADVRVMFTSLGTSQGEAMQMQIVNDGARPVRLGGDTLVLEPIKRSAQQQLQPQLQQRMQPRGGRPPVTTRLEGYCLEVLREPPTPGQLFRIASQELQQRFQPVGHVLRAAKSLQQAGRLTPDITPKTYFETIKQYALWTQLEKWDMSKFRDAFVERTKKNIVNLGRTWTKDMEKTVDAAVPSRWRDITMVLNEAAALAASPQAVR